MKMNFRKKTALMLACIMLAGNIWAENIGLPKVVVNGKQYYCYTIQKDDSIYGIAKKFGWNPDVLVSENPDAISALEKGGKLYYPAAEDEIEKPEPVIEAPQTEENENVNTASSEPEIDEMPVYGYNSTATPVSNEVKIAVVMSQPKGKKDLELVRGMLVAIDELKKSPYKIGFRIINGNESVEEISENLKQYRPSLIVSTADNVPAFLTNLGDEIRASVVNVFDVKSELFRHNPSMVQLMIPSNYFNDEVVDYISTRFDGSKLVIVGEEDDNDAMLSDLKERYLGNIINVSAEDLQTMPLKDGSNYLVYCAGTKFADAQSCITGVNAMCGKTVFSNYGIMMRPNLVLQDKELLAAENRCDIYVPTRYYLDENSDNVKDFNKSFADMFDHQPIKAFPVYAVEGYDLVKYFLPAYMENNGNLEIPYTNVKLLQNGVSLHSPNRKGLVNTSCYILRYLGNDSNKELIELKFE